MNISRLIQLIFAIGIAPIVVFSQNSSKSSKITFINSLEINELTNEEKDWFTKKINLIKYSDNDTLILNTLDSLIENISNEKIWYPINNYIKLKCEYYLKNVYLTKKLKNNIYFHYANALNNEGYLFYFRGNLKEALEKFKTSIPYFQKLNNLKGLSSAYNNIASIYDDENNVAMALEYHFKSLKIKEKLNDSINIGTSYNNISLVFQKQGDLKQALKYAYKSLYYRSFIKDSFLIANSYNNLALINSELKNIDLSIYQYIKCIKIREAINDERGLASSYNNLGFLYLDIDLKLAEKYLIKSYYLRKNLNDKKAYSEILNNMAVLEFYKKNYSLSEKYGLESYKIAQKNNYIEIEKRSCSHLFVLYKHLKRWELALKMNERYVFLKDILTKDENKRELYKRQYSYQYEKQRELDEKENEKKLLIARQKQQYQKNITIIFGVSFLLLVILIFFLIKRHRQNVKQKKIIQYQKEIVELKNIEITSSINYAKRIQTAILPSENIFKKYFKNYFVLYEPKDIVAGDFYWLSIKDDYIFIAVADCTGHGVPGAMVSVVCNNALNRTIREFGIEDPGKILDNTRDLVVNEFEKSNYEVNDGMDISLCSINFNKMQVLWSGANNPLWILRNREIIEFKPDKQPIGKYVDSKPFTTHFFDLQNNDELYLFTDGYQDQFGGEEMFKGGKKLKQSNLKKIIISISDLEMSLKKQELTNYLLNWRGNLEQIDDICIIGIKV